MKMSAGLELREELEMKLKPCGVVLSMLTAREEEVLNLYFGHSWTLKKIGERFLVTRERIRQIKEKALRRLRHQSRGDFFKNLRKEYNAGDISLCKGQMALLDAVLGKE